VSSGSVVDELLSPSPKGKEFDVLLVQLRELGIARKFRIKDQGGFHPPADLFPEREKVKDLVIGFGTADVGGGIKHQSGIRILGKQRQSPFHGFASGSRPVLFEDGFFSIMRNRMEIEIDDLLLVESQAMSLLDKGLLKTENMDLIQRVGIRG